MGQQYATLLDDDAKPFFLTLAMVILAWLILAWLIFSFLPAVPKPAPASTPASTSAAAFAKAAAASTNLSGPLITAGDAAALSARGVLLRLCKGQKRCDDAQEQLSHLTPAQRRRLGGGVWLASLALPRLLTAPARAPAQVLVRSVRRLRALFAARTPAPTAAPPAPAYPAAVKATVRAAAAKAAVRSRTAARPGVVATATNAGDQQFYLVLERTRRSGAKRLLLEVPLPRAVNAVTRRVLHNLPQLVY